MGYNMTTLAQTSVMDVTPNGAEGAIWGAGGGFAADSSGYIYFLDANGTFDTTLNAQGFPVTAITATPSSSFPPRVTSLP